MPFRFAGLLEFGGVVTQLNVPEYSVLVATVGTLIPDRDLTVRAKVFVHEVFYLVK